MGDIDPRLAGGDGFPPVFCQPSTAPEPCKGAFEDPSSGQDFEAPGDVGAFYDLERPLSDPVQGIVLTAEE